MTFSIERVGEMARQVWLDRYGSTGEPPGDESPSSPSF